MKNFAVGIALISATPMLGSSNAMDLVNRLETAELNLLKQFAGGKIPPEQKSQIQLQFEVFRTEKPALALKAAVAHAQNLSAALTKGVRTRAEARTKLAQADPDHKYSDEMKAQDQRLFKLLDAFNAEVKAVLGSFQKS